MSLSLNYPSGIIPPSLFSDIGKINKKYYATYERVDNLHRALDCLIINKKLGVPPEKVFKETHRAVGLLVDLVSNIDDSVEMDNTGKVVTQLIQYLKDNNIDIVLLDHVCKESKWEEVNVYDMVTGYNPGVTERDHADLLTVPEAVYNIFSFNNKSISDGYGTEVEEYVSYETPESIMDLYRCSITDRAMPNFYKKFKHGQLQVPTIKTKTKLGSEMIVGFFNFMFSYKNGLLKNIIRVMINNNFKQDLSTIRFISIGDGQLKDVVFDNVDDAFDFIDNVNTNELYYGKNKKLLDYVCRNMNNRNITLLLNKFDNSVTHEHTNNVIYGVLPKESKNKALEEYCLNTGGKLLNV